ncbi:MAG: TMAO reductase system periplasmic protein TorT [Rhodospirillaceae bacterium]|nr:TMAO reductase system periplasmic protein TorT [Rhodospirillaceae bacterium]
MNEGHLFRNAAAALIGGALAISVGTSAMAADWSMPVSVFADDGSVSEMNYEPLDVSQITQKWNICVVFPHVKDPYYLAYTYGAVSEAQRIGAKLQILAAGGYTELAKQISLVEDCVAGGADAVVITAVSTEGLNPVISETVNAGVPVIDLGTGVTTPDISGRVTSSYEAAGINLGEYLKARHPVGSGKVQVLWLPGPAGSGWVEDATRGFQETIVDSDVEVVKVMYGDTGKTVQMTLIEDGLLAYPEIEYIAGAAPAAEGAVQVLRQAGVEGIEVMAYYPTPATIAGLSDGTVSAVVSDNSAMQPRIAIDMAVRILEGIDGPKNIGPGFFTVDTENVVTWDSGTTLSPEGWEPVFEVE